MIHSEPCPARMKAIVRCLDGISSADAKEADQNRSCIEAMMTDAIADMVGNDAVDMRVLMHRGGSRKGAKTSPRFCLSVNGATLRTTTMPRAEITRVMAELAAAAEQYRARIRYSRTRADAGIATDGERWGDAVLVHPAMFLIEFGSGREMDPGSDRITTSGLLDGVTIDGSRRPRRMILRPGSPVQPWAKRRSTLLEIETRLPESILMASSGRSLTDIVAVDLPEYQLESYSMIRIESARMGGSSSNPKAMLILSPIRQVMRGRRPEHGRDAVLAAWEDIIGTAQEI